MKRSTIVSLLCGVYAVVSLLIITSKGAYAYIDPGTGSYVLQVVAASVLAGLFIIKSTWQNIRKSVGKLFGKNTDDAE